MNDLQSKTVEIDEKQISIYINKLNKEIWISQDGLMTLYQKSRGSISAALKEFNLTFQKLKTFRKHSENISHISTNGRSYTKTFYDQYILFMFDEKYNSTEGKRLYDLCFKNSDIPSNVIPLENYEIVRYSQGNFSVDVHISEDDKNICMSKYEKSFLKHAGTYNNALILNSLEHGVSVYKDFLYAAQRMRKNYLHMPITKDIRRSVFNSVSETSADECFT